MLQEWCRGEHSHFYLRAGAGGQVEEPVKVREPVVTEEAEGVKELGVKQGTRL